MAIDLEILRRDYISRLVLITLARYPEGTQCYVLEHTLKIPGKEVARALNCLRAMELVTRELVYPPVETLPAGVGYPTHFILPYRQWRVTAEGHDVAWVLNL